ncbi:MAG: DNA-processing protein DprA [Treponema sp.]|jgi:DNA processing protein|nr:DNA-processing protein DprA [Treponema sp.]
MVDRGLVDLIIGRIPRLTPAERVRVCIHCNQEADLFGLSKRAMEDLVGRSLKQSWNLDALHAQAEQDAAVARMRGIGYVAYVSPQYPPLLREIYDPPAILFYRGKLPNPELPIVGVVGTRHPSAVALTQAYALAKDLAYGGIPVIAGLALGIDGMAHRGNSDGGAPTIAVLGSGLDEVYPAGNRLLAQRIVARGGVLLSEYPPGTTPRKWHFPARNRIISALARGTVIVEAPESSGALITARFALEQGRDLWVASAGLASPQGAGTQKLAREGAQVISSAAEIFKEWGITPRETPNSPRVEGEFSVSAWTASLAHTLHLGYEDR